MRCLWAALIAISVAAALWGYATANERCPATGNLGGSVAVTLALVVIGAVALLPPAAVIRLLAVGGRLQQNALLVLLLSALWLFAWAYVWWHTWYINFGCVD